MSMLISFGSTESTLVESTSSARSARDTDRSNASGTDAFAAALAHVMHVRTIFSPVSKNDGANSELDARASSVANQVNDRKPAFAAAAEARAVAAAASVDSANARAEALNPDFRTRLGRVITRMHDEFGKDVRLVEGYRTQSRQDFLYDQGRTRPGEVVTWTKSSKHTLGLAADVTIDGAYTDAAAFQELALIATQEGLQTLGAKDPGHIELPSRGGAVAWGASADLLNIDNNVSRAIGIALDRGNAVGGSAGKDDGLSNFNGMLSRAGRGSSTSAPPIQMPSMSGAGGGMAGNTSQRDPGASLNDAAKSGDLARIASVADVASVAPVAQVAQLAGSGGVTLPLSADGAPVSQTAIAGNGTGAADRVGRMLDTRDSTPAPPLSHVTLNVDNAAGGSDKITVQLRGGAVDTSISLGDPNRADRMSLRIGELQHALEQHGLDATAIRVASTAADTRPGWTPRQGSDQSAQNGRPSPNHRDNRQDADETRQRARKEQHGGRQK